jgi:hypothetical protein
VEFRPVTLKARFRLAPAAKFWYPEFWRKAILEAPETVAPLLVASTSSAPVPEAHPCTNITPALVDGPLDGLEQELRLKTALAISEIKIRFFI